jgi:two-component system, OmpR family, response regulator
MVGAVHISGRKELTRRENFNVFIVDDEQSSLSALGYRLTKENPFHNYHVHCFSTGEECVKHLWLEPQLIIMDQYLACQGEGSLCGARLLRRIRKENHNVPIVIVSGKRKVDDALLTEDEDTYYMVRDAVAYDSVQKILRMMSYDIVH